MGQSMEQAEWFKFEFWRFVFVQQEVARFAQTFIEFPPMQTPAIVQPRGGQGAGPARPAGAARAVTVLRSVPRGTRDEIGIDPDAVALLLDMERALHVAALPADVVEERVREMAIGLGMAAEIFTSQSFTATELRAGGKTSVEIRRIPFDPHWNLTRISDLLALARAVAEPRIPIAEARVQLHSISARANRYPKWLVVVGYAVYAAAVAARVGGRWCEMLVALVIGALVGGIHFGTLANETVDLEKSFIGAFVGGLAVLFATLIFPPFDAGRALFGGVTLLVPAMTVTIGLHELANGALESGAVRLLHGMLRFLMLAFGIAVALNIWKLVGPLPPPTVAAPFPFPAILAAVAVGGLALVVCLQGRPSNAGWMIAAAVIAYGAQELSKIWVGGRGSPFVAAFVLGAAAHLHRRWSGRSLATMIVPGLLQLAPGFLGTEASMRLLRHGAGTATFFDVMLVALQLGTGLLIADLLFRRRRLVERMPAS